MISSREYMSLGGREAPGMVVCDCVFIGAVFNEAVFPCGGGTVAVILLACGGGCGVATGSGFLVKNGRAFLDSFIVCCLLNSWLSGQVFKCFFLYSFIVLSFLRVALLIHVGHGGGGCDGGGGLPFAFAAGQISPCGG